MKEECEIEEKVKSKTELSAIEIYMKDVKFKNFSVDKIWGMINNLKNNIEAQLPKTEKVLDLGE